VDTEQEPAANPEPAALVPPVFAFKTLLNQLDYMKERGVPARIDRSFLIGMSGAGQAQYITGLRSLGLIDATGAVSDRLIQMANGAVSDRRGLLREILRERYAKAIELGKTNATTGMLVELFREEYGATGDTARKGIAFYLNAARYAGDVPLSPMFQTPKVSSAGTGRRRKARGSENGSEAAPDESSTPAKPPLFADVHPALAGVLSELPRQGAGWTTERRDAFMTTFQAVVNFTIPIVTEDVVYDDEEDDPED